MWDYATSLEAAIAQHHDDAVLALAKKYIQHPDADAFELGIALQAYSPEFIQKLNGLLAAGSNDIGEIVPPAVTPPTQAIAKS